MMNGENKVSWTVGNGGGVYDPVTTSDNVQFSDQKPWLGSGRPRTYNFGTYKKSGLKGVCDEIRNRSRPKCLFVTFIIAVTIVLLLLIIVLVSNRHSDSRFNNTENGKMGGFEKWESKPAGLSYLPAGKDNTVLIAYRQEDADSFSGYTTSLEEALKRYKTAPLRNHSHEMCNQTYHPGDVICQQPLTLFGKSCKKTHKFGYHVGQPCVLLYFNLPNNSTVRSLLPKDGDAYIAAEEALKNRTFSFEHVAVSCKPATPEDGKYVSMTSTSAVGDAPIEYHPKEGFPTYFFRSRTVDDFIPPAVMVQFRTIHTSLRFKRPVRFTCTAYGMAYTPDGQVINSDGTFNTSVVFSIH